MIRSSECRRRKYRSSVSPSLFTPRKADLYLVLELTRTQYFLRSFALGGFPYFQLGGALPDPIVDDVISGRLTSAIMALFPGIDTSQVTSIVCDVVDGRQSIALNYSVLLGAGFDFRVMHQLPLSESVAYEDLLAVKASDCRSSDGECARPAE
jgi:hypothetical protein